MPGTPAINGPYTPVDSRAAIPARLSRPLKASIIVGRGQFCTVDLADGYATLNDGTLPGHACAGNGDPSTLSDTSSVDGAASVRLSQRWVKGLPASGESGDDFTDVDFGLPFWIADENTPGKLSNFGGSNRSLGGLVFGLGDDGNPILWTGPVAWLIARAAHQLDRKVGAWGHFADGDAADATAELALAREPVHGTVTGIEFVGDAAAADGTNDAVITVSKRDGAGGAAVTLGTYSTNSGAQGAITAFVPAQLVLSAVAGALNLLETDIVTVTVTKGGTGQTLRGAIRVIQKVI